MFVARIDAHSTYVVVTIVNNTGELVHKAQRIKNADSADLLALLEQYRPIEAVVETCPAWPATNVLSASNVRDTSPLDCSKRTWPEREVGRYTTCRVVALQS
jgi:hypothetical protein